MKKYFGIWGDRNTYIDCGDDYTVVYIVETQQTVPLNGCISFYVYYIHQ